MDEPTLGQDERQRRALAELVRELADRPCIAGLGALRVPYAVTFVLVAGARSVPTVAAELRSLAAAYLLGVLAPR